MKLTNWQRLAAAVIGIAGIVLVSVFAPGAATAVVASAIALIHLSIEKDNTLPPPDGDSK